MNLHEYQAKSLLKSYGLPVPEGYVAENEAQAIEAADKLGGGRVVVKAQVHAGGRGKAGGVKLVDTQAEMLAMVNQLLGTRLVTFQTTAEGQPVNQVLVEAPSDIANELYLSAVLDRAQQRVVFMASTEGGMDIEEVAEKTPEKILQFAVDPLVGVMPYQCRKVGYALGLNATQIKQFVKLVVGLGKLFVERDLSLLEINPLVITGEGDLLCLDCKINMDDNAAYRQKEMVAMRDRTQEDERENRAAEWELNYVALDGNIGCMVNGAGLAMATMDLIQLKGGKPANFLDVGGGATQERVTEAFKIILSDESVEAVLVNIFGGIVRCDLIADGVIGAVADVGVNVPVIVRLEGNRADLGMKKLEESGLNIIAASSFNQGAELAIDAVKENK